MIMSNLPDTYNFLNTNYGGEDMVDTRKAATLALLNSPLQVITHTSTRTPPKASCQILESSFREFPPRFIRVLGLLPWLSEQMWRSGGQNQWRNLVLIITRRAPTCTYSTTTEAIATVTAPTPTSIPSSNLIVEDEYPRPDPQFNEVLRGTLRDNTVCKEARKLRRVGKVPSIVFSAEDGHIGGHKRLISLERLQIRSLIQRCGERFLVSRTFDLEVKTNTIPKVLVEKCRVLPKLIHIRRANETILNVTLIRAPADSVFKVNVPIVLTGEEVCTGLRKGGHLRWSKRSLLLKCPVDLIPPYIEADVSELDIGQILYIKDLKYRPQLKLLKDKKEYQICKVIGSTYKAERAEGTQPQEKKTTEKPAKK